MFKRLLAAFAFMALSYGPSQAAIVGPLPYTLTNGQPADAAQVMANFNKIVNDVNVNVIFPSFTQQSYYAAATGTANALIVSVSPAPGVYAPGMVVNAKIATTNTGPATINVNGLGSQNIVNVNGSALRGQQLLSGMVAQLSYDGSQFQLQSQTPAAQRQNTVSRTTQLFTTAGAWTWTVPAGIYAARLQGWGAGGQGGAGVSATPVGGGAGAGGAYGLMFLSVVPGDVLSGNLGAGGSTGTSTTAGQAGGTTTVLLNGVSQGSLGGGAGGVLAVGTTNAGPSTGGNASGSWAISSSGGNGLGANATFVAGAFTNKGGEGGLGGGAGASGGNGGVGIAAGSVGGNPGGGGGGGGGTTIGGAGGNGWVYIEY